jgi:hypothetical protein
MSNKDKVEHGLAGLGVGVLVAGLSLMVMAPDPSLRVGGGGLDGSTVTPGSVVTLDYPGADAVRWSLDSGPYLEDRQAPFEQPLDVAPGAHRLRARVVEGGDEVARLDAKFSVSSSPVVPPAPPAASSVPVAPRPTSAPTPTGSSAPAQPQPGGRAVLVSSVESLERALAGARPGDVIQLAPGRYVAKERLEAAADGTEAAPVTLTGPRDAVITTDRGPDSGQYGLHVTGDWWRVVGLTVDGAKKGVVMDGADHVVLDHVAVTRSGQEAVHFRADSDSGVIRDSLVEGTGLKSPAFGEGVYVGSAHSNWGSRDGYGQPYGESGGKGPDRSDGVLIEGNTIRDTTAEGVDVKEGTRGTVIRGNRFEHAGYSGENSADSWVDVKGTATLVEDNEGTGTLLDAFQVHVIGGSTADSGMMNEFKGNRVLGGVPGVTVGVYPKPGSHGNVVRCDNQPAPGGLSNISCTK